ncbi:exported hypothetical protein [Candidatus Sulfopaludibacter sp. SbA4]|nr:exported hypothetical protein [Candidatus Sulfopaludibacter sp. SbA4]
MRTYQPAVSGLLILVLNGLLAAQGAGGKNPCPSAQDVPPELKIPASLQPGEPADFERRLLGYFGSLKYRALG